MPLSITIQVSGDPMSMFRLSAVAASVLLLGSLASAQFTAIGPFSGTAGTESFESQSSSSGVGCINGRIFGNKGDLCSNAMLVTSGWGFNCSIAPHSGSRFTGSASGIATYNFDQCVSRFGGYFGNNTPSGVNGVASFYDGNGNLVGTEVFVNPNTCTWTWNGWDFNGAQIQKIEVSLNGYGAFTMMDDMEADFSPNCSSAPGVVMCAGDGTGGTCPCGNFGGAGKGCSNSATNGAELIGAGLASVGGDTLVLSATNCPTGVNGGFFGGTAMTGGGNGLAFGDGLLCAGGSVSLLQLTPTNASGDASSSVSIHTMDGSSAGDTRYYQFWFRDPGGVPCGANFNTSGALQVIWGL
jgi:hypothetical protein